MLDPGRTEDALDRERQRVIGVADDHRGRAVERPEELLPRRLVLTRKGLKARHPRDRRPPCRVPLVPADGGEDMKATAGVGAAVDPEVLAIDRQRVRPPIGQRPGAHELAAHIDPVRDQLPLVRWRATRALANRPQLPTRLRAGNLRRRSIARSLRDRYQRLTDLTRREPILPRARLTLPRLQPGRALDTERIRLPLTGQDGREPVLQIPIPRPTAPPLPTMRRLPVPPIAHDPRASVLRDRTLGNLHYQATLSPHPDDSTRVE